MRTARHFTGLTLLAMAIGSISACTVCGTGGDVREQITFSAAFHPDDGRTTFTTELLVREGESGLFGPGGPWWETAIIDASLVEPGIGTLMLASPERTLALALPLPHSTGDVLPVVASSGQTFTSFY